MKESIEELARGVAASLKMPIEFAMDPTRIYVRIGEAEAKFQNWDASVRAASAVAALGALPCAAQVESLGLAPQGLGFCAAGAAIAGGGLYCYRLLQASYNEKVTQLEIRAEANAVSMQERAVEAIVALWTIENRPFLSTKKDFLVSGKYYGNHLDDSAGNSLRSALRLIRDTKPASYQDWEKRRDYDQQVKAAKDLLVTYKKAWFRTADIPWWLNTLVFWPCVFLGGLALIYPGVADFLKTLGG